MRTRYNTEKEMILAKIGREVEVFDTLPQGWKYLEGTLTEPLGYRWASNGKSIFSKEYEQALVRMEGPKTFEHYHKN